MSSGGSVTVKVTGKHITLRDVNKALKDPRVLLASTKATSQSLMQLIEY